jgi:hypothetical protein
MQKLYIELYGNMYRYHKCISQIKLQKLNSNISQRSLFRSKNNQFSQFSLGKIIFFSVLATSQTLKHPFLALFLPFGLFTLIIFLGFSSFFFHVFLFSLPSFSPEMTSAEFPPPGEGVCVCVCGI